MTSAGKSAGTVLRNEPMSKHTTWRVGGPADVYYSPRCRDDLQDFVRGLDANTPVYFVGLGSNLLVRDGGVRGAVIATGHALNGLRNLGGGVVEAEAGVPCTVVARQCSRWELGPAEFFAGIPGSVGGALRMNAGAFGGETWEKVIDVDVVDRRGNVRTRGRDGYQVGYRQVRGPLEEWFLAARFKFDEHYTAAADRIRTLVAERKARQPLGLPSCGSVFKNPPGDHAARLIEAAGLKGARIGGAEVSPKHANFIINTGGATAADIEALINRVRDTVLARHGIRLDTEVQFLGEPLAGPPGTEGAAP
ncbi:MAG: UDP-N-acetylmuramate dehydrogenase [Gammaproteobacteria bacterium]|nr:UDP-N-acetylmuramate dehydrogenase [Gammaproteobacteria bacterium]